MLQQRTLGIDIGGVIIDAATNDNTDTSFLGGNYLRSSAVPDAFSVIARLVNHFEGRVHIVSKCGAAVQQKSREWLSHTGFYRTTGAKPENLHFCLRRHEKAPICEALRITDFIDDRLEVLSYMKTVERRFLFRPKEREVDKFKEHLASVIIVNSWQEVASHFGC